MRHGRVGFWYRFVVCIVKPASGLLTKRDWRGAENIPREGGVLVVANHLSYVDPMLFGHFVYNTGRTPRFLAKSSLFTVPVLKWIVHSAKQIPVYRGTADAAAALTDAVKALNAGECVLIYPEGSATRDADHWPMKARTGVARLALMTDVPIVPVAQWGPQEIWRYKTKRPTPFPRKTVRMLAGPPIDLSAYRGRPQDAETLREITDVVMHHITELLMQLRDGTPPAVPYDPRGQAAA